MCQWHPLHLLQSPPHCSDLPFFLSRTMLRTAMPTTASSITNVIVVPTSIPPFKMPAFFIIIVLLRYFASTFPNFDAGDCPSLHGLTSRYNKAPMNTNALAVPKLNVPVVTSVPIW